MNALRRDSSTMCKKNRFVGLFVLFCFFLTLFHVHKISSENVTILLYCLTDTFPRDVLRR